VPGLTKGIAALVRVADRCACNEAGPRGNWLGRVVILRLLGLVYTMAFLTLARQGPALLGPLERCKIGLAEDGQLVVDFGITYRYEQTDNSKNWLAPNASLKFGA